MTTMTDPKETPAQRGSLTDEQKDRAVKLYEDHVLNVDVPTLTVEEIYQQTGVSRPALYLLLQQQGITPRRRRKGVPPDVDASQLLERLARAHREIERLTTLVHSLEVEIDYLKFGGDGDNNGPAIPELQNEPD